ncbi:hypothetical protein V6N12_068445 [Hibiscus sabdariffa]|uniref:Uncharacterized protein n=1 Tax=Hibiscus sabdariffa TaxID=183260 RepID=A0ABR2FQ55_9ROSI
MVSIGVGRPQGDRATMRQEVPFDTRKPKLVNHLSVKPMRTTRSIEGVIDDEKLEIFGDNSTDGRNAPVSSHGEDPVGAQLWEENQRVDWHVLEAPSEGWMKDKAVGIVGRVLSCQLMGDVMTDVSLVSMVSGESCQKLIDFTNEDTQSCPDELLTPRDKLRAKILRVNKA